VAQELPTGTVTFLFTDIEGSTSLLHELGPERYAEALAEHRLVFKNAIEKWGGIVVDTQGDAFFVAFASATASVRAAADAQRALAETEIRARMGLHSGEAIVAETGYVGADVHRGARICAAAHGGQVLLSQATRELVEDALAEELGVRDLGEHRLKDLTRPQRLHQLLVAGLPLDFPPPATLDQRPTNLPVQPAPLIGRERELEETRELLSRTRLLTLTGPGGAGKTRLAIQLAADVLDDYDDGAFFVDLADIADPALVVPAVAQTLGVKERGGLELGDAVADYLSRKSLLLLLDNVEQVVQVAPDLSRWVSVAPSSKLLATGRTPLRVAGEQEYAVPPLPQDDAIELFVERARAVRPDFALDGDRAVVGEICARLDALPLAIELAAARIKLLPPPKLLERLDQTLPVLTGGARDAPARHRTLRAAIDWSFGLLEPEEQELFERLSVFAGGFTLEAAEAVCDATIDGLASLVEKSLLAQRQVDGGEPRFSMLETVREFARERLEERGPIDAVADAHADYFLLLAQPGARGAPDEDPDRGRFLYFELDNVRRARAWLVACGDVERELRLATAAFWSVWTRANLRELLGWLASALDRAAGVDPWLRAEALGAAALAAANSGERELAREYASESLALAREWKDKRQIEWALRVLCFDEPDLDERRRMLRECERLNRERGNDAGLGWVTFLLGQTFADEGSFDQAFETFEQAAAIFDRLDRSWEAANAEVAAAYALVTGGRPEAARPILERTLRTTTELESPALAVECLSALAIIRANVDPISAARILAAAQTIGDEAGHPLSMEYERGIVEEALRGVRDHLADRFESEWEAGRQLTLEQTIALALEES
jgi:predicted ATPase/class 3 adenylate cyclase